ncbi:MAG: DUF5666 domain-containing protein [Candidatus Staskawiczbacteria bacterium]|nr:DUF5666 domain-containing protein [Candidatus Staskawiczbacteria bacterium]
MKTKKYISLLAIVAIALGLVAFAPVFAKSIPNNPGRVNYNRDPNIVGTVSVINGTTITMTGKAKKTNDVAGTATTYTVNASSAKVIKNGASSSISSIAVGDTIVVQGTVSGTNIVAKTIRDGAPQPAIKGNGQPVVAGKVTSISGSTITIANNSNVTYTIDASNAKFIVSGITGPTLSNIAVGDSVLVQGNVNGTSVVASSVIDQKAKVNNTGTGNNKKSQPGFMGGIANFFKNLFGF